MINRWLSRLRGGNSLGSTTVRGRAAERRAANWLRRRGYRIVKRNLETPVGEIDLVALDGDTLCFIEVKSRSSDRLGRSVEAVDARKQARLSRAAAYYLAPFDPAPPCRFDVLGIDATTDGKIEHTLIQGAFDARL